MKDERRIVRSSGRSLRTKRFGLAAVLLFTRLPRAPHVDIMGRQMLRSATSVGAHYREACRARSDNEFISKTEGALQELDETSYWLELITESGAYAGEDALSLLGESDELIRIFVTIVRKRKKS
jgi:four helix bundle protein